MGYIILPDGETMPRYNKEVLPANPFEFHNLRKMAQMAMDESSGKGLSKDYKTRLESFAQACYDLADSF